jgi:hypothetical protein
VGFFLLGRCWEGTAKHVRAKGVLLCTHKGWGLFFYPTACFPANSDVRGNKRRASQTFTSIPLQQIEGCCCCCCCFVAATPLCQRLRTEVDTEQTLLGVFSSNSLANAQSLTLHLFRLKSPRDGVELSSFLEDARDVVAAKEKYHVKAVQKQSQARIADYRDPTHEPSLISSTATATITTAVPGLSFFKSKSSEN